jgi:membrane protein DedA with SNARE-associated domain
MITHFITSMISWYMSHVNYWTITLLMAIESTFLPFPSELIVPPAAFKAFNGELNISLVMLFATIGALLGSLFNYFFALILGRKLLYRLADSRWAHMIKINRDHLERVDRFFEKYGKSSIFIGRLVPGVRHLLSIPAGIAKMDLKAFSIYTTLGAFFWNIILAALGYFFFSQKELLNQYYKDISIGLLGLGLLFVIYLLVKGFSKRKKVEISKETDVKTKTSKDSEFTRVE